MNEYEQIENYKLTENISVTKRIHHIWKSWSEFPSSLISKLYYKNPIIGKYQYLYKSDKGQISLIELPNYFLDGIDLWEVCGSMTEDGYIMKFNSKEEAEVWIKSVLE